MSAVPKKKLCWNCEGNIAIETDNCPYCAVYLHPQAEEEENPVWNPSYRPSKTEEIPSPLYQIHPESEQEVLEETEELANIADEDHASVLSWSRLYAQLKRDIFPILFLMMGSVFFLFGVVLLLFCQNGTLTLQWQESDGIYFLLSAIPLVVFGWRFLQQLGNDD